MNDKILTTLFLMSVYHLFYMSSIHILKTHLLFLNKAQWNYTINTWTNCTQPKSRFYSQKLLESSIKCSHLVDDSPVLILKCILIFFEIYYFLTKPNEIQWIPEIAVHSYTMNPRNNCTQLKVTRTISHLVDDCPVLMFKYILICFEMLE